MSNSICEQAYRGNVFAGKNKKDGYTVYHIEDTCGSGELICYDVIPGVQVAYNNLHMDSCFNSILPEKEFLQIDYCLEGCYEFEIENNIVYFLGEGDLCVSNLGKQVFIGSRLPLKKYRGITVIFEIETAQESLNIYFPQANISLKQILDELCMNGQSLVIKARHEIDHIFSELYQLDERIKMPYLWIKVMELLLFLNLLDSSNVQKPITFSQEVSQGTQNVYQYIIENPFAKITIAELARMFHIAESSMKRCFKFISGNSIGTFMKMKRMEAAAEFLLRERKLSIREVSEIVGYENQSKFSAAFKSIYGVTPYAYRRKM